MMNKLSFLAGVGAGYVLGARAGRGQYDQLKSKSTQAWQNPSVQAKVAQAADTLKAKTPSQAHGLVDKAVDAVSGGTTPASSQTSPTAGLASETSSFTGTGPAVPQSGTTGSMSAGMPTVPIKDTGLQS